MFDILTYPHSRLKSVSVDVSSFDDRLCKLADEMAVLMYSQGGVGLAAPQIGLLERMIIIDPSAGESGSALTTMVNPKIVRASVELEVCEEGCLSIPGVQLAVARHSWIAVEFVGTDGVARYEECSGFKSRIVQHEIDHLDGLMMLDRVGPLSRRLALDSYKKLRT